MNENSRPLVSICIPTFNRGKYLDYLLNNIIEQIGINSESVQVVVSDNFSTDDTWSIIIKYQKIGLNLKYVRNSKNHGFVVNLNSALQVADGEYCWLMGDDDAFRPGAIAYMSELIKTFRPDIAISNRFICDIDLKVLSADQFMPSEKGQSIFDCNDLSAMLEYFSKNTSTVGMFNFISVLIIKRECWFKSSKIPGVSTTLFSHVFKVLDIIRNQHGRLLSVAAQTVFARTENDRLDEIHEGSEFKKWQLHFQGNVEIADHFFTDNRLLYDAFLSPIKAIILAGKQHYISLAEKDGFLDEALATLKKLGI